MVYLMDTFISRVCSLFIFFFFNDTATTEIYTLSLHDALPIWRRRRNSGPKSSRGSAPASAARRSEEHTSELQSRRDLVCRLLLEKKIRTETGCVGVCRSGGWRWWWSHVA